MTTETMQLPLHHIKKRLYAIFSPRLSFIDARRWTENLKNMHQQKSRRDYYVIFT